MINVGARSRFKRYIPIIDKGVETWGFWVKPAFLTRKYKSEELGYFRVDSRTEGKPHLIAEEAYGSAEYEWIIIAFNDVADVFTWPRAGDVIRYPLKRSIISDLM